MPRAQLDSHIKTWRRNRVGKAPMAQKMALGPWSPYANDRPEVYIIIQWLKKTPKIKI
jgi:hypothetical protein